MRRNPIWIRYVCVLLVLTTLGFCHLPGSRGTIYEMNLSPPIRFSSGFENSSSDWWPMFHHNLSHQGYSSSYAPETNAVLWEYMTGGGVLSSPAVYEGNVYIGSGDHKLYCLQMETGSKVWEALTGEYILSSPAVAYGMAYVGSIDFSVYAFDAQTGAQQWSYQTDGPVYSSPAVAYGKVFIGSYDNKIYSLDAYTGEKLWEYVTGHDVYSSPAVVDGKVYVGSDDNNLYCINASTGGHLWTYTAASWVPTSPTVVDGRVYFGSFDHMVYCLNATTGTKIWDHWINGSSMDSPAVAYGKVYIGSWNHNVYCLDANTGAELWTYTTGNEVWSSPAVAAEKLYIGSVDNNLYCLDVDTGRKIWEYETGNVIESSPSVVDGKVYIGCLSGIVYCFGVEGSPPNQPHLFGPQDGETGREYTFITDTVTDPDGDALFCLWEWGDENSSGWLGPYPSGEVMTASYSWTYPGEFAIRAKLKDVYGLESNWSESQYITIRWSEPPIIPVITGPHYGRVGVAYDFTLMMVDPEGNDIAFLISWGDGSYTEWLGPYPSGQPVIVSHAWTEPGTYPITVKARDLWGAQSPWSEPFFMDIVRLKPAFFIGTFNNITQTDDLIILRTQCFIILPSYPMVHHGDIIVIAQEKRDYLGKHWAIGIGGIGIL
jgi:outer membrane protein assembly factor BamB